MRDIIWTIIIIWVVWRLIDAFRSISSRNSKSQNSNSTHTTSDPTQDDLPKKGELKSDAGEYVDYEEVK